MEKRQYYRLEDKVKIVREHLENQVSISSLAEKYEIHPTQIRKWEKSLFEGVVDIFSGKHRQKKENSILAKLKQKLLKKDEIISIYSPEYSLF